jgi:pyrroloquinoline quinone (PQQ) biosynthesis protein C
MLNLSFEAADTKLSEATKSTREKYGFTDERAVQFLEEHLSKIKHDL